MSASPRSSCTCGLCLTASRVAIRGCTIVAQSFSLHHVCQVPKVCQTNSAYLLALWTPRAMRPGGTFKLSRAHTTTQLCTKRLSADTAHPGASSYLKVSAASEWKHALYVYIWPTFRHYEFVLRRRSPRNKQALSSKERTSARRAACQCRQPRAPALAARCRPWQA